MDDFFWLLELFNNLAKKKKNELLWDSHSKQKGHAAELCLLLPLVGFFLDLSFSREDGGNMFL
jgi:hypothetical protein